MILKPILWPGDELRSLIFRLAIVAMVVLLLTLSAVALSALWVFDRDIRPELLRKAQTLGDMLEGNLQRAVDAGLPLAELPGVSAFFDDAVRDNDELRYVALTDARGHLIGASSGLAQALGRDASGPVAPGGTLTLDIVPVAERLRAVDRIADDAGTFVAAGDYLDVASIMTGQDGAIVAILHLGVPDTLVAQRFQDIVADVGVALLVAIIVTLEVLGVLMVLLVRRVGTKGRRRSGSRQGPTE